MIYFYVLKFSWKEYGKGECYLRRPLPYSLLVFCAVQENHTRATMTVECWTQRTILSRLPLYFSLFDSFPPSQCGFYQTLKDYCRVFPQINNESIAKPSSRFVDSNGPHTTLCYHSAKGHFAASKYSWIFGKRKFVVFMSGKFMWTACSAHMQILTIPGGGTLFHIYWMYNFIPSQPSLDNIHALVHCFTNSSLARREGLKFQDTVYECVRADRFSVYAKKVRWPRNFLNCTSPIMHLVCLVPKFCISVVFNFSLDDSGTIIPRAQLFESWLVLTFFFCSKSFSLAIFSIHSGAFYHPIVDKNLLL